MAMVWPLWNLACGGQRGLKTCDALQSARKQPGPRVQATRVKQMRPGVSGAGIVVEWTPGRSFGTVCGKTVGFWRWRPVF